MAKKKTTRFTLRLPEELDEQLEQIGKDLGLNKTSLIHYLIHKSLPDLQLDALLYRKQVQEGKMVPLSTRDREFCRAVLAERTPDEVEGRLATRP